MSDQLCVDGVDENSSLEELMAKLREYVGKLQDRVKILEIENAKIVEAVQEITGIPAVESALKYDALKEKEIATAIFEVTIAFFYRCKEKIQINDIVSKSIGIPKKTKYKADRFQK